MEIIFKKKKMVGKMEKLFFFLLQISGRYTTRDEYTFTINAN